MRKLDATELPGTRAYLCDADPSAQDLYHQGRSELEVRAKLWFLLFDHVFISAGHMVISEHTFSWLEKEEPAVRLLAQSGALLPSLRNDRRNLEDYVLQHSIDDDPWWPRHQAEERRRRAQFLDELFQKAITWRPIAEGAWFRRSMLADLRDAESPLRRRLVGVPRQQVAALAADVEKEEVLDRSRLSAAAERHCPRRRSVVRKYGDILYHVSGAIEKAAFPALCPAEAELCQEKAAHETRLAPEGTSLWQGVISALELAESTLKHLTLKEIAQIREERFCKAARVTWASLLQPAGGRPENLREYVEMSRSLGLRLGEEIEKESGRSRRRKAVRSRIEASGWVIGIAGSIASGIVLGPSAAAIGAAAGLVGFLTGKPILDHYEKRPGTELVVLTARLRRA
jgi:hypothetical protein